MNANVKDVSESNSIRVFEAREDIRCVPPPVNSASLVPKPLRHAPSDRIEARGLSTLIRASSTPRGRTDKKRQPAAM